MASLTKISDAKIDQFKDDLMLTAMDSRSVHFGVLPKRWDITDDLSVASVLPSCHNGIVVSFDALIPEFPLGVDRVHFDVVVSSDGQAVLGNAIDESLVSSRRLSDEHGGFFVESDYVYYYPTAGLSASSAGQTVHIVISNVDVDPYYPVYVYWRPRWYASDAFHSLGDFYGMGMYIVKSLAASTGSSTESNQIIELPSEQMSWPIGKEASFEVYVGATFRDSSVNHAGFRYYNGEDVVVLPQGGVDGNFSGNSIYLTTNPIDISAPIIVRSRAKWDTGQTNWYSKIHFPEEKYTKLTALYYPQKRIVIPKNTYGFDYNVQVIAGTSSDLADYFAGGDTSLNEPDTGSPYLHDYSDSGNSSHSGRFSILDGSYEIDNPGTYGFSYDEDNVVVYSSPLPFLSDSEMYIMWRVRQAIWSSSSSSSSSSSLSSSSSSSSTSFSSSSSGSSSSLSSSSSSFSSSSSSSSSVSSSSSSSNGWSGTSMYIVGWSGSWLNGCGFTSGGLTLWDGAEMDHVPGSHRWQNDPPDDTLKYSDDGGLMSQVYVHWSDFDSQYILRVYNGGSSGHNEIWRGEGSSVFTDGPVGTYTKDAAFLCGPASMTLAFTP
jgi:hypothetical protein